MFAALPYVLPYSDLATWHWTADYVGLAIITALSLVLVSPTRRTRAVASMTSVMNEINHSL